MHRDDELTISEVAARTGVAPSALRFYEDRGFVRPLRTLGNQRRYTRAMLRTVSVIKAAQAVGLSLDEIEAAFATLPGDRVPTKGRLDPTYRACGAKRSTSASNASSDCATISTGASAADACRYGPAPCSTPKTRRAVKARAPGWFATASADRRPRRPPTRLALSSPSAARTRGSWGVVQPKAQPSISTVAVRGTRRFIVVGRLGLGIVRVAADGKLYGGRLSGCGPTAR